MRVLALLALCGCAHVQVDTCGQVEGVSVDVARGGVLACPEALGQTQHAVAQLAAEGRPLTQPWRLLYTWEFVGLDMYGRPLWGVTRTAQRESLVRVFTDGHVYRQGPATLHELRHASDFMHGHPEAD